jgi:hypothetical protein
MTDEVALPEVVRRLCPESQELWCDTLSEFEGMDERALHVLLVCVESLHRRVMARQALEQFGAVYVDRLGNVRPRPEIAIERNSQLVFLRALRQLSLALPRQESGMPFARMGRIYRRQQQH